MVEGGLQWMCVWFSSVVFVLEAWQGSEGEEQSSHLYGFSQIVARWLGAFLSLSPEGTALETSLHPHLPLLIVLSCSGML